MSMKNSNYTIENRTRGTLPFSMQRNGDNLTDITTKSAYWNLFIVWRFKINKDNKIKQNTAFWGTKSVPV
jgi:hypothetical protein